MQLNRPSIVFAIVVASLCFRTSLHAEPQSSKSAHLEQATLGLGCYSCAEAMFKQLNGVESVVVGYSGGSVTNPTDEQVSSKKSGHAEVVHIEFDPTIISYDELLEVFWKMHDPTTVNRQGSNVGPQYRSVIFYHNDKQRTLAEQYKEKLNATHAFDRPIVTEIAEFKDFYPAAKKHQDFFGLNPKDEYCTLVIQPKVEEFEKVFAKKLRPASTKPADQK